MDCDKLLEQCLSEPPVLNEVATEAASEQQAVLVTALQKKLASLAPERQAKQYISQAFPMKQTERLSDNEIEALYMQHEMRLGSIMTGSLTKAVCEIFSVIAGKIVPILSSYMYLQRAIVVDKWELVTDLELSPFAGRRLNFITCEL